MHANEVYSLFAMYM